MPKPLLFLDVDGTVLPLSRDWAPTPEDCDGWQAAGNRVDLHTGLTTADLDVVSEWLRGR